MYIGYVSLVFCNAKRDPVPINLLICFELSLCIQDDKILHCLLVKVWLTFPSVYSSPIIVFVFPSVQ